MQYFVYILMNKSETLYIGVTNNLERRIWEHKNSGISKFTSLYKTTKLVYYETFSNANDAIKREKQLKNWHREWKLNLIKSVNPDLNDLSESLIEDPETSSG